jgi:hypothetical protein
MIQDIATLALIAIGAAMILRQERCPLEVIFGFILILIGFGTHC